MKRTNKHKKHQPPGNDYLSVEFSPSVLSDSLWPHGLQHTRPPCPSPTPRVWNSGFLTDSMMPSNHVILCRPLLLPTSSFPASGCFPWVGSLYQVAKVLEFQLQHQSFQWICRTDFLWDGLVGSPCSPRDAQESSLTPQFKSINFSVLSSLYSPNLTSIHDHWKNHSLDYMDIGWQSNVSAFQYAI